MKHPFLYFGREELAIEAQQLCEEGALVPSEVSAELEALMGMDLDDSHQPRIMALFEKTSNLPILQPFAYSEPSDLTGIQSLRPPQIPLRQEKIHPSEYYDRVYGAWLGRCAGCLLGSPLEGLLARDVWPWLKTSGRYPLDWYIDSSIPAWIQEKYPFANPDRGFIDQIDHVVANDDLDFTVANLALFKRFGSQFSPQNVATFWLRNLPLFHTFSAERVAMRNLTNMIDPPLSATYHNPYREWIGAQIRGDFWGYVAPCNPGLAAEYAWRDACISHIKNGIYGEMWVAAMISAAFGLDTPREVIEAGLSQIPATCRLAEGIRVVMDWYENGETEEGAIQRIHRRWDEANPHHWCHTISNAQIVALGLLWGNGDFAHSICLAVQAFFDTDCNGATVGSIMGALLGASRLPQRWIAPFNDRMDACIDGYNRMRISELAGLTVSLADY